MNRYLMSVRRFFSGEEAFEVEAENKSEALEKGSREFTQSPRCFGGNYDLGSFKVIKKLQVKDKKVRA